MNWYITEKRGSQKKKKKGSIFPQEIKDDSVTMWTMQAFTLKKYPAQLSLTAWINLIGGAQSAAFTVLIQHKPAAWSIAFNNIDFWSIVYAVIKECERISNYYFCFKWCFKRFICQMAGSCMLRYNNLHSTMVHWTKRTSFCDHV